MDQESAVEVIQEVAAQAGEAPPVDGLAGLVIFWAFLFIMLVVPWLMSRGSSDPPSPESSAEARGFESRFSSDRERRLWLAAAVVMVAIYSTLGPVAELARALRERNLLGVSSGAALLLVGLVIAVHWARNRPGRLEIGAGLGVAAAYLTTVVRMPIPEARSHLFEYGLVAMLIYQALLERRRNGRNVPVPWLLAAVATALLGWLDEGIQAFLPNRHYDLVDVGLNAAFGTMAIVASLLVGWARRRDIFKRAGARTK